MPHHPAQPVEPRQKCNGRPCHPNKHAAEHRAKEILKQTDLKHTPFKCKQCGMWHLKLG